MKDIKDITACVVDHGLFLPIAQKLSEQYKRVLYCCPHERAMKKISEGIIGDGFDNLELVEDVWDVKTECDLFVFPDIGFAPLQRELIRQEFPVWGHHGADILETNRGLFLKTLNKLGMDIPKYEVIRGMDELKNHLKDKEDKYIKVSKWRADWETMHWRSWDEDEHELDRKSAHLGPVKKKMVFYVFDSIPNAIEDGIDSYNIGGQFPSIVMHGIEKKDKSYLCAVQPMNSVDEKLREITERFGRVLGEYGYAGFFSSEVRLTDNADYFIDPTCRAASPPSQVMTELFGNLGEIIWHGANGHLIDPEPSGLYGAQVLLTVDRDRDEWAVMDTPQSIRKWVKLGFACQIDGQLVEPPHDLEHFMGWLVATGKTMQEAIEKLKQYKEDLPDGVECNIESMASLVSEVQKAEDEGVEFGKEEIPEPETVI